MVEIEKISNKVKPIMEKYGIKSAGVFGSYARGEAKENSDVDILITPGPEPLSIFGLMILRDELESSLNKPVDLITDSAVITYFRDGIYKDLKKIYG